MCVCIYSNYVLAVKLQCICNVGLLFFKLTKHEEGVLDINDWVKLRPLLCRPMVVLHITSFTNSYLHLNLHIWWTSTNCDMYRSHIRLSFTMTKAAPEIVLLFPIYRTILG